MNDRNINNTVSGYTPPDIIGLPPMFVWPIRPIKAIKWIFVEFLFPWGFLFIGLAIFSWNVLTPEIDSSGPPSLGFMGKIWLKNVLLLGVLAGSLHWWLYSRERQGDTFKFSHRWLSKKSNRFLWSNQTYDNVFWSIVSGVTVWSLFEGITLWAWISGVIPQATWPAHREYIVALTFVFFFVSSSHFYLIHRLLHWKPLYRSVHELHHRNVNTGPWSGISMHPVEHLLFFSMFFVWWLVPVHPVVIILTGFFKGLGPAVTHSGFDRVLVGGRQIPTGDWFHDLHHRHFETNYGNIEAPFDWAMNTWHNGSNEAQRAMVARRKLQSGASEGKPS